MDCSHQIEALAAFPHLMASVQSGMILKNMKKERKDLVYYSIDVNQRGCMHQYKVIATQLSVKTV